MHGLSLIESFAVFQTHSKKPRAQRTQGLNNGALIERATKNPAGWLGFLRYKCLIMFGPATRRAALRYSPGETPKKQNPDQMAGVSK